MAIATLSLRTAAQTQIQLKNNLLYDLSLTPNASAEVGLSRHWTADVEPSPYKPVRNLHGSALKSRYRADYDYLLTNVYPHLRRTDYEITFRVREFTLQEACHIYLTHPDQLSLYEFWQVAHTFDEGSADYDRCLQTAFTYYPDSTVAALNVAHAALRRGDTRRAAALLSQAGQQPEAVQARAVLAILQQRYDEAAPTTAVTRWAMTVSLLRSTSGRGTRRKQCSMSAVPRGLIQTTTRMSLHRQAMETATATRMVNGNKAAPTMNATTTGAAKARMPMNT